ncbi:FAD/NAD(P)-binding domain-containing protein [Hypoxylon sp. FL1150]|nr:FAD/NAD(P)-binding domain-containing protein [Hypoxylon sp. FL1150]
MSEMSSRASLEVQSSYDEYPAKADLRKDLCQPLPLIATGTVDSTAISSEEASKQARIVLSAINDAWSTNNAKRLAECFFVGQAFWRDMLALTSHLRTFTTAGVISTALLETKALRGVVGDMRLDGTATFVTVSPVLHFVDCRVTFKTTTPGATCSGRLALLPTKVEGEAGKDIIEWKIWFLCTWIENLDVQVEDEGLLKSPGRNLEAIETIETNVLIIGGGNSGIVLSARLKALGVESVIIDRNAEVGDNWILRYECLTFHIPTSGTELPYLRYDKKLQTPHLLTGKELGEHLKRYASVFNLDIINSVNIHSTIYDQVDGRWVVKFQTPDGHRKVICKQLVQATGIGSHKPYLPSLSGSYQYKGITVHSAKYKSGKSLVDQGAKSALVIGSANTGFDIIEDCYAAGLETTMVVRSPTYIVPMDYLFDARSFGAYDNLPIDVADKMLLAVPTAIDTQLVHGLLSQKAFQEPDRYKPLADAGFPVIDSCHPDAHLQHHLLERAGGHYVDMDKGVHLIADRKVGVKGGAEPVAFTETGLRFSDGSTLDADAIVWCTGFADCDARTTAEEILSGGSAKGVDSDGIKDGTEAKNVLGPSEIAARLDATWALDAEGEIRGLWKRPLRLENYWVMGGHAQLQRWYSRILAQQIKLALEGTLPPAYRDTPKPAE